MKFIKCIDCGRIRKIQNRSALNTYQEKFPRCHSCAMKAFNAIHKGYIKDLKKCTICKEYQTLDNYNRNKSTWDGLSTYCKSCNRIKMNNYYHNYTENARRILYKSMTLHKDRQNARVLSGIYYPERQLCETEGCVKLGERHHDDYKDPHHIRWLCKKHHTDLHQSRLPQYGKIRVDTIAVKC